MPIERRLLIVASVISVVAIAASLILFFVYSPKTNNKEVTVGEEMLTKGQIVNIDMSAMVVDGDGIIELKTLSGKKLSIAIPAWPGACQSSANSSIFKDIKTGDKIEVMGVLKANDTIDVCSNKQFYIKLAVVDNGQGKNCTSQGEYKQESSPECCPGLIERSEKVIYQANCLTLPNAGVSLPVCIPCGDGECDPDLESECNCPEDCEIRTCKPVGENNNCDRSCQLLSDCLYTCGCGAINKNESCDDSEAIFDCGYSKVECRNNLCVVVGEVKHPWESSICGNGICETCESADECCNYPCSGQACPPPSCEGYCPEDCSSEACVQAGEYVDHPDKDSFECCSGLSKASALPLDENCKVIIPKNSPGIEPGWACLDCGDQYCNEESGENKCNCPEDCALDDRCYLEPDPGICRADLPRYYFDQDDKQCAEFSYGGCEGVVPFETLPECQSKCENIGTSTGQAYQNEEVIYEKRASWGPCPDPDGGCWENEFLYLSGTHETVTKNGTSTKELSQEAMEEILTYIKISGLLTAPCEFDPVVDYWVTYTITMDGEENKITFPGCEDELAELEDLIK